MAIWHTLIYQFVALPSLVIFFCAGVVAVLAADRRHQYAVEEAGCDFIHLAVETFGVWSLFALRTLHTIADCTTARSGAFTKQAQKICCNNFQFHYGQIMHICDTKISGFTVQLFSKPLLKWYL